MDFQTADKIATNIQNARDAIARVQQEEGVDQNVLLMAVSKTVGLEEVQAAIDAGVHDFGENRTSELKRKAEAYPEQNWHMIGRIQTNKLKDVVGIACLIHSVASEHAADAIDKLAAKQGIVQSILLEVNVSGEESKDGFKPEEVNEALQHCEQLKNIEVRGFMTMAPLGEIDTARHVFGRLYEIMDKSKVLFKDSANINLTELSMGMTQDFEEAVAKGATIVRLGRSIFA